MKEITLRVLENKVLRRIFLAKRKEVTGWRKFHNLYVLCKIVRVITLYSS